MCRQAAAGGEEAMQENAAEDNRERKEVVRDRDGRSRDGDNSVDDWGEAGRRAKEEGRKRSRSRERKRTGSRSPRRRWVLLLGGVLWYEV